jgi:hypothetical protein
MNNITSSLGCDSVRFVRWRWFTRSRAMWEGCTRIPCDYDVPAGVRLVYCLEMGFYMQVGVAG